MNEPRVDPKEVTPDAKIVTPDPVDPDPVVVDDKLDTIPMADHRKVREEAARYRTQLRALEQKVLDDEAAAKLADMSENQRLKAEAQIDKAKLASMKTSSDNVIRKSAIVSAASVANFQDPQDVANLLDISKIDVDDDGNIDPEQVVELVKALAEEKSYLLKGATVEKPGAEFGATSPASPNAPGVKLTTATQIDRMKKESSELMRAGKMHSAITLYNRSWELERGKKPEGG